MQIDNLTQEKDLIRAAQNDPQAFNMLYERYIRPVYRFHYRHVENTADAEDLTAQTFMTALESLPRYRLDGHFPGWLFAIARNKLIDFYRRNHSQTRLDESAISDDTQDIPEDYEHTERTEKLRQIVQGLGDEEKEILYLRYVAGLSFEDVSVALHKSTEAVKKNLYRLLDRLRQRMENEYEKL